MGIKRRAKSERGLEVPIEKVIRKDGEANNMLGTRNHIMTDKFKQWVLEAFSCNLRYGLALFESTP